MILDKSNFDLNLELKSLYDLNMQPKDEKIKIVNKFIFIIKKMKQKCH